MTIHLRSYFLHCAARGQAVLDLYQARDRPGLPFFSPMSGLILGAETVNGREAAALGLVQWVVPAAELPARAMAIAAGIAALPAAAVAACKRCIHASLEQGVDGYQMEVEATATLLASDATQERVRQFLARKR